MSIGSPSILRSSWKPVMPFLVPQILKSMSPKWSSAPMMSVRTTCLTILPLSSLRVTSPQLMPDTGVWIGTPASMRLRQPPQTEAMEVEPLDSMISDTTRIA